MFLVHSSLLNKSIHIKFHDDWTVNVENIRYIQNFNLEVFTTPLAHPAACPPLPADFVSLKNPAKNIHNDHSRSTGIFWNFLHTNTTLSVLRVWVCFKVQKVLVVL